MQNFFYIILNYSLKRRWSSSEVDLLKIFTNFTGKHLFRNLSLHLRAGASGKQQMNDRFSIKMAFKIENGIENPFNYLPKK